MILNVIVYPIITLGYLHIPQIKVRPIVNILNSAPERLNIGYYYYLKTV